MDCPTYEELIEAFDDQRPGGGPLPEHLSSGCSRCRERWWLLGELRQAHDAGPTEAISEEECQAALWLFRDFVTRRREGALLDPRRTVVLRRAAGALAGGAGAGSRTDGLPPTGEALAFRGGDFRLDLDLAEAGALRGRLSAETGEQRIPMGTRCVLVGAGGRRDGRLERNGDLSLIHI